MSQSTRQTLLNIAHAVRIARDGMRHLAEQPLQDDFANAGDVRLDLVELVDELDHAQLEIGRVARLPRAGEARAA